jgi:hypothetical protein
MDVVNTPLEPIRRPRQRQRPPLRLALALLVAAGSLSSACRGDEAASAAPGAAPTAPSRAAGGEVSSPDFARLGEGLVAWESRRSGAWRIWIRNLDGSGLRQLSPDEPGRQHCCAHLSPDGRHVAYLSLPEAAYGSDDEAGPLLLVPTAGGPPRQLAVTARTYGRGHRAGVWHSPQAFQHVDAQGNSVLLDITSGATEKLAGPDADGRGWLVDPTRRWATTGVPTFSPLGPGGRVEPRTPFGGCEPSLSDDGRWGLWVAGAGGPLRRVELATRTTSDVLLKNDQRLPGRSYLYFPSLSNDRLLLTFAASEGEHNHSEGDYDVFVAPVDPRTLELLGDPLRYTSHPTSDRYPSVWAAPLPLGRHFGEAPFSVSLAAPAGPPGPWQWDFGDGTPPGTGDGRHTFTRPGTYTVEATSPTGRLRGSVVVEPAAPPQVVGLATRERELLLSFDEPVDATAATGTLASGLAVTGKRPSDDGRSLALLLAAPVTAADRLELTGIRDRAQTPNTLPPATLEVPAPSWPTDRRGLAFLWQAADQPNLVQHPEHGSETTYALKPRGRARLDRNQAMVLDQGAFTASGDAGASIVELARRSAQLTLEVTLAPRRLDQNGTIVSLAAERGRPLLVLSQHGRSLRLQMRLEGRVASIEVAKLRSTAPAHLAIAYTPGRLLAWLDGREVLASEELQGDFFQWKPAPLVFGNRAAGDSPWAGTLEGVAIWDRALAGDEVAENHRRSLRERRARPAVAEVRLRGTLLRRARTPTLEEIAPYRDALAVHEIRVGEVLAGTPPGAVVRVARWAILDGAEQPEAKLAPGTPVELRLEPYLDQPQLESLFVSDEPGARGPLFFDAGAP